MSDFEIIGHPPRLALSTTAEAAGVRNMVLMAMWSGWREAGVPPEPTSTPTITITITTSTSTPTTTAERSRLACAYGCELPPLIRLATLSVSFALSEAALTSIRRVGVDTAEHRSFSAAK